MWLIVILALPAPGAHADSPPAPVAAAEVVVVIHGLGRSRSAMWLLASRLEDAGFDVVRVGYRSLSQTPEQIHRDISGQIEACCVGQDRTVHFVGHSLGGLLVRAYLQHTRLENLGRVVLLGTPSQGSELVDRFRDRWWMSMLGPTASALGTAAGSFPNALDEPYYAVGVIAGVADGIPNEKYLPGEDDGLVTVEATKLVGMTDFIVVDTGHSAMRYNQEVAEQTVAFLRNGMFVRPESERQAP